MFNMFAVIRLRSGIGMKKEIEDTLKMLRLHRKHHCVLLKNSPSILGMLQKVKDYVTWGEISDEMLAKLVEKRGRKPGNVRLTKEEAETAVNEIKTSGKPSSIKPVFRLSPPSKGFKSIKQHYPKGDLGYRKDKINDLLKRMI